MGCLRAIYLLMFILGISNCYSQSNKSLFTAYHLDKTIVQNKSVFKFWVGNSDSNRKALIIQRIHHQKDTILFNGFVKDAIYELLDMNNDGYKDFITSYHDCNVIHFFNKRANGFRHDVVELPSVFELIDSKRKIYWGYGDAQYSEPYDYSILYSYKHFTPYYYYKVVFKTEEAYSERNKTTVVELYGFKDGNYNSMVLIKKIKPKKPAAFNYKQFWKANYRELLCL
jgi:hypothetical protein